MGCCHLGPVRLWLSQCLLSCWGLWGWGGRPVVSRGRVVPGVPVGVVLWGPLIGRHTSCADRSWDSIDEVLAQSESIVTGRRQNKVGQKRF